MNWKYFILIVTLIACAAIPIIYKTWVLGIDFFPAVKQDVWVVEYMLKIKGSPEQRRIIFPVPKSSKRIKITETQFEGKNLSLTIKNTVEGAFAKLSGITRGNIKVFYRAHVESQYYNYEIGSKSHSNGYPSKVTPFLQKIPLEAGSEAAVARLENELFRGRLSHLERVKTLFYFLHEEILKGKKHHGIEQSILKSKGSSRDKAEVFTVLARRQGVPARTVIGITLEDKVDTKRNPWYWNEVYLEKQWVPVLLHRGLLGEIPAAYLPLATSEGLRPEWPREGKLSISAERLSAKHFSAFEYKKQLIQKSSTLLSFSPYMLPLSEQAPFKLLLLFAFGTVVLAFCRNIVGMKSFGIFFPVLLALFFKDTSLLFGVGFFAFIVFLGLLERRLLRTMHLLAVPRFAIILTLLVMTLLLFAILNNQYQLSQFNPSILPIIITTMFIERFSITWEEEGWFNSLLALLGTFFIALVAYGLFSWELLERLLYTHPETLFVVIALLIMIGRYTGYRLSEIIRFRELLRQDS